MFRIPEEAGPSFRRAEPPHLVIDEFCTDLALLSAATAELHAFPPVAWAQGELCQLLPIGVTPPATRRLIDELQSDACVARLRALTALDLFPDPGFFETGAQAISHEGMPLHADFNIPITLDVWHRLCLLLFLEPGPPLTLVGRGVQQVHPAANRAVIFHINDDVFYSRMPGAPTINLCMRYYTMDRPAYAPAARRCTARRVIP